MPFGSFIFMMEDQTSFTKHFRKKNLKKCERAVRFLAKTAAYLLLWVCAYRFGDIPYARRKAVMKWEL